MSEKSPAAVALGKLRWEGVSKDDRRKAMGALLRKRWDKRNATKVKQ